MDRFAKTAGAMLARSAARELPNCWTATAKDQQMLKISIAIDQLKHCTVLLLHDDFRPEQHRSIACSRSEERREALHVPDRGMREGVCKA
eukprot:12211549-Karenia_brevis.AAC.1